MQQRANRYEIHRPLEYRIRDSAGPIVGAGHTLNISRKGVLFQTERELKVGRRIELVVRMGTTLGEGPDVNLLVQGVTVRSHDGHVAVAIKKYKLRSGQNRS